MPNFKDKNKYETIHEYLFRKRKEKITFIGLLVMEIAFFLGLAL